MPCCATRGIITTSRVTRRRGRPGVFKRFQLGFERRFEALRQGYLGLLGKALARPKPFAAAFLGAALLSLLLVPFLGRDFFPAVESPSMRIHLRAPTGTRVEDTSRITAEVEREVRRLLPRSRVASIVNNIGLPGSGINITYGNTGTIGVFDDDMLVSLNEGPESPDSFVKMLRERLPADFPGTTFSFLPADMVSQILNFGSPAPLDVQVIGADVAGNREWADALLTKMRHVPGIADPRIQERFGNPAVKVDFNRELAGLVGLTESDAAASLQATLSGSTQTAPTYWLDPKSGVSYPVSVQTPQYAIDTMGDLKTVPMTAARSTQLLGALAKFSPESLPALVSHYDVKNTINIYATSQERDLGGVIGDVDKLIAAAKPSLPRGSTVEVRGQAVTMSSAYSQLVIGLAFSIVLIYLLIVVNFQSWLDPFVIVMALPAALAGIAWMLFLTHTRLSVAGADRCDHVHGRGHRELDPGHRLRPRAAGRGQGRARRRAGGRRGAAAPGDDDGARDDHRHGPRWRSSRARTRLSAAP